MSEDGQPLPVELEELAPGPQLTAILAKVDRTRLSAADRLRLARARNRLVAHQQAELLADLYSFGLAEPPEEPVTSEQHSRYPWAEAEVAFAMRWTRTAAGGRLELARQLIEDLPQVQQALRQGLIDMPKALVVIELAGWLWEEDPATVRRLVDKVIEKAPQWTTGQLRARLRQLILAVDPEAATRRCASAIRTRRVECFDNPDGTGEVWGRSLPPQDAAAAFERLTAIARAAKSAGDGRSMVQLRADALLDLLIGEGVAVGGGLRHHTGGLAEAAGLPPEEQPAADPGQPAEPASCSEGTPPPPPDLTAALPAPRRGVVELQLPLTTAIGIDDLPGEINGFGPVVADIARQVLAHLPDAQWRYSVYNKLGELVVHGITHARPTPGPDARSPDRRRPTAAQAGFVRARDRTCVAPGCRRPARACDLDHTQPWVEGGQTTTCNLGCLCRGHHLFKHTTGCQLHQIHPGVFVWQTPRGLQYLTKPDPPLLDRRAFAAVPGG